MARKNKSEISRNKRPIESYEHRDKARVNNPPVGLVTPETDPDAGQQKKTYAYDPHLDPQLVWAGKAEHISFEVPTVSLHVHERIAPRTILEAVRKNALTPSPSPTGRGWRGAPGEGVQLPLFEMERKEPLREAIEFYQHKHDWSNRLIAGDSLLVMNSLLEKEGLGGKVQMIYIDPPYGIRYGSNFQPFVNKRDVKDGRDEDLTSEPEQIRAFRDTWELGIHSYLTYLRDRLLLARELLTESGSIFVQISDENVHHVRELMDEVFGAGNFVSQISFRKTTGVQSTYVASVSDYLLWYSKNKEKGKFRKLFREKTIDENYSNLMLPTGGKRKLQDEEFEGRRKIPDGARVFRYDHLLSSGPSNQNQEFVFEGKTFVPPTGNHWKSSIEGLNHLARARRIEIRGNKVNYIRFFSDFAAFPYTNFWDDTTTGGDSEKIYVVQTTFKVIERCLLMTTDPGDLVFDPTCGSGTTAYVAEQWGRRWITCDTSRVALTLARQRLMTAVFDYYELAHPEEGVGSGFKYKTVPHVTLKSIANNPEIDSIYARMHPAIEKALADLNAALKSLTPSPSPKRRGEYNLLPSGEGGRRSGEGYPRFKVTTGGRVGQFVDFAAPDSATFTMPSGQVVKVNELVEWEVPFEFPADWPQAARKPFEAFHATRRAMQKEMDAAIARHAPQETLYDQPYVDRKKVRVTGPFTVEAVPAPVVKSPDEILPSPTGRGVGGEGKKPLPHDLLQFARQLRKEQTDAERLMWALLRDRRLAGFKFRRQHPVEPYVLDFYCHEARLAIEIDGGQHNEPDARLHDEQRTAALVSQGIHVLRFWNNDVLNNTESVLQTIYDALTPALSQREREFMANASIARSGETLRQGEWRDELLRAGIRGKAGQYIRFARLEPLPGCRWLHADGETRPSDEGADRVREMAPAYNPMRVVVSFGPEHAPLEQRQVAQAIEEAQTLVPKPKLIVFAAFQFDPEAAKDIDETNWPGVTLLKAQMNADLLTDDLKKKRASNESFWLIGQPDVEVERIAPSPQPSPTGRGSKGEGVQYRVSVHGFDYYNTKTGQIESGGADKIAVWMLDTDYDGRSLYPRQVFFPMAGDSEGWAKLARNLKAEIDADRMEAYRGTVSLPFESGEHKRIAVKIVDDRGIESLKILELS